MGSPNGFPFSFYFYSDTVRVNNTLYYEKKGSVTMLQFVIGTVAFVSLSIGIKVEEAKMARQYKECEETDWNWYYAHN